MPGLRHQLQRRLPSRVLVWGWAAVLPIDVVEGIPRVLFDGIRYAGVAALLVIFPTTDDPAAGRALRPWGILLGCLALVRISFALYHGDDDGLQTGMLMAASLVAAGIVGLRTSLHRTVLMGFLAGATLSAIVTGMQSLGLATLAPGEPSIDRYPGLAASTIILTWQLAFAIIIAVWSAATTRRRSVGWFASLLSIPFLVWAMLVCGTQGGLFGLVAAAGCVLVRSWSRGSSRQVIKVGLLMVAVMVATVIALHEAGVEFATLREFLPSSGYENERARGQLLNDGLKVIADHPLVGTGTAQFQAQHRLVPHFLPVHFGVAAGLLGLGLGSWVLIRLGLVVMKGPAAETRSAVFGWALVAAMLAYTIPEPVGPFAGLNRLPLLAIGYLACLNLTLRERSSVHVATASS